jgi:opacity protein-like surface antigen
MKPRWFVVILPFMLSGLYLRAQELYITGLGGYTFQNTINLNDVVIHVRNSAHYGVSLEGVSEQGVGLEFLYQRQQTHAPVYSKSSPEELLTSKDDVTVSYFMLNPVIYIKASPTIKPYLGLGIGVGLLDTDAATASGNKAYSSSQTKFTWDAKAGVRFSLSQVFSVKVQTQVYGVSNVNGQGLYYAEASSFWLYQFGFSAGVCYRFFKSKPKL